MDDESELGLVRMGSSFMVRSQIQSVKDMHLAFKLVAVFRIMDVFFHLCTFFNNIFDRKSRNIDQINGFSFNVGFIRFTLEFDAIWVEFLKFFIHNIWTVGFKRMNESSFIWKLTKSLIVQMNSQIRQNIRIFRVDGQNSKPKILFIELFERSITDVFGFKFIFPKNSIFH